MDHFRTLISAAILSLTFATSSSLAEVLFTETFESNDLSASASGDNINSIDFNWEGTNKTSIVSGGAGENIQTYPSLIVVNDSRDWAAKEGNSSFRFRYGANANMTEQRFNFDPKTEIWIGYWVRDPANFYHGSLNNPSLRHTQAGVCRGQCWTRAA